MKKYYTAMNRTELWLATMQVNLTNKMLGKRSQRWRNTDCMTPFT